MPDEIKKLFDQYLARPQWERAIGAVVAIIGLLLLGVVFHILEAILGVVLTILGVVLGGVAIALACVPQQQPKP